jgi:hypothetical protein
LTWHGTTLCDFLGTVKCFAIQDTTSPIFENLIQRDRDLARKMELMEMNLQKKGRKKYFITIA